MEDDRKVSILPECTPDDVRMYNVMQSQSIALQQLPPLPSQAPPPPPSQAPPLPSQPQPQNYPNYQIHSYTNIPRRQHVISHVPSMDDQLTRPPPPLSAKQPAQSNTNVMQLPCPTTISQSTPPFHPPVASCEECPAIILKNQEVENSLKIVNHHILTTEKSIECLESALNCLTNKYCTLLNNRPQQNQQISTVAFPAITTQRSVPSNVYETSTVASLQQGQSCNFPSQSNVITSQQGFPMENADPRIQMTQQSQSFVPNTRQANMVTSFSQIGSSGGSGGGGGGNTMDQQWVITDQVNKNLTRRVMENAGDSQQLLRSQQQIVQSPSSNQQRPQQQMMQQSYGNETQNQYMQYPTMMVSEQQPQVRTSIGMSKIEPHQFLQSNVNQQFVGQSQTNQTITSNQDIYNASRQTLNNPQQSMTYSMNQQVMPVSSNPQMMQSGYSDLNMRVNINPNEQSDIRYVTPKYYTEAN